MKYSDQVWQEALTYIKYIEFLVSRYQGFHGLQRCDLIQEAIMETCNAIVRRKSNYNEQSFRAYLKRCILNRLRDYTNQCGTLIRHSRKYRDCTFEYPTFDEYKSSKEYTPQKELLDLLEILSVEDKWFLISLLDGATESELGEVEGITKQAINLRKQRLYKRIREL